MRRVETEDSTCNCCRFLKSRFDLKEEGFCFLQVPEMRSKSVQGGTIYIKVRHSRCQLELHFKAFYCGMYEVEL